MWLVIPLCGVAALIIFIVMATEYSQSHEEVQNELAAKLNGERVLNEYDPDAIKIISDDRHHLGYIPSGQTDFVRYMSANEFPYRCTAFIEKHQDESDGHKFFVGFVYIKRLD